MNDDPTIASEPGTGSSSDGDEAYCSACGKSYPVEYNSCPADGARLAKLKARPDALLGRVFEGRYEVRTTLGQGGMGTVYRGWQLSVDREVAIKVIHPKLASDRIAVKRFLREARLSSRLSQPSIVNVYDFGQTDDGILYIVMELLRGHTLARELEGLTAMPLKRVVTIGLQLCDALDAAHGQHIVHRDLKPGNIVILDEPPGRDLIKVLDFGLAKTLVTDTSSQVTNTNAILGTPLYMAPEQIESKPSDQRADLYAFGCMLYQMVTGRPPFTGDNVNQVLAKHIGDRAEPLPIGVPPVLAVTIERLMEKEPAKRTASAAAVRTALQNVLSSGFSTNELADTTPEIPPAPPAPPADLYRSAPIALAVTDPAHSRPMADSLDIPPRQRRLGLLLVGFAALAAVALVIVWAAGRDAVPARRAVSTIDAGSVDHAAAIDAVVFDAPADAFVTKPPVDAPPDAPKRVRPKPRPEDDPAFQFQHPSTR